MILPDGYCWAYAILLQVAMFKVSESFEETPIEQEDLDSLLMVIKGSF